MATSSMKKDFIINDKKAFEQLKRNLASKPDTDRRPKPSSSLKYGEEKLEGFLSRQTIC